MGFRYRVAENLGGVNAWHITGDAQLITIDAEHVITPGGDPTLVDGAYEQLAALKAGFHDADVDGHHIAIATNNKDAAFVNELEAQMPAGIPVFSGLEFASKKTSPDMFLAAARHFGVEPRTAWHVDDQYLSMRGARMAGFMGGVLLKPSGPDTHRGVKLFRVVDASARLAIGAMEYLRPFR